MKSTIILCMFITPFEEVNVAKDPNIFSHAAIYIQCITTDAILFIHNVHNKTVPLK